MGGRAYREQCAPENVSAGKHKTQSFTGITTECKCLLAFGFDSRRFNVRMNCLAFADRPPSLLAARSFQPFTLGGEWPSGSQGTTSRFSLLILASTGSLPPCSLGWTF